MVLTAQQGPTPVQPVRLGVMLLTGVPHLARCVALARTPLLMLSHVRNVPQVPTRRPHQRHLLKLAYHARKDLTLLWKEQHRARSAHQAPISRIQGPAAPQAVCHVQLAATVQPQELPVLVVALPVRQAHSRHLLQLPVQPVMLVAGQPQTPQLALIA